MNECTDFTQSDGLVQQCMDEWVWLMDAWTRVYVALYFLDYVLQGGIHLFNVMDTYGPSGTNLLFIACFESVVVAWVYGEIQQPVLLNVI